MLRLYCEHFREWPWHHWQSTPHEWSVDAVLFFHFPGWGVSSPRHVPLHGVLDEVSRKPASCHDGWLNFFCLPFLHFQICYRILKCFSTWNSSLFLCVFFLLDLCLIKNTCWSGNEPFSPFIQHACCVGCCWDLGRHARASIYMVCTCICTLFLYLYLYLSCCFCSNVLKRVGLPVDMHVTGIATISWLAIKLQKSMMVGFTSCMFVSCLHTIFFKLDLCTK